MNEERRESTRFGRSPEDDFAAVRINGDGALLAEVHDESLRGISLILGVESRLNVGQTVQIDYVGSQYEATVRHVTAWTDNKLLIGFRCELLPAEPSLTDDAW